jgi:hypothetical protein
MQTRCAVAGANSQPFLWPFQFGSNINNFAGPFMPENCRELYDFLNVASLVNLEVCAARRGGLDFHKYFTIADSGNLSFLNSEVFDSVEHRCIHFSA